MFGWVTKEQLAELSPQELEKYNRIMKKRRFVAITGSLFLIGILISSWAAIATGVIRGVVPAVLVFTGGAALSSIPIGFCLFRIDKYESPEERIALLNPHNPLQQAEHGTFTSIEINTEDSSWPRWPCWPCSFFARTADSCRERLQQVYDRLPSLRR